MKRRLLTALAALTLISASSDPAERLSDPAKEGRARAMFRETRCLVCQGESIDDSDSDLARDLRRTIRERITAGASDADVRDFLKARYGDFVLLRPPVSWPNALLWSGPFVVLAAGAWLLIRRRQAPAAPQLSAEEEAEIASLEDSVT